MPTGLPGEAVESIFGLLLIVDSWSRQGTFWMKINLFSIVFALCDNLPRLSLPKQLPQGCVDVSTSIFQPFLSALVTSELR